MKIDRRRRALGAFPKFDPIGKKTCCIRFEPATAIP